MRWCNRRTRRALALLRSDEANIYVAMRASIGPDSAGFRWRRLAWRFFAGNTRRCKRGDGLGASDKERAQYLGTDTAHHLLGPGGDHAHRRQSVHAHA